MLLPREWGTGVPTPVLVATQTIPALQPRLAPADVKEAFADQGLSLASYEIGPGIPALVYPVGALEGDAAYLVVCEIYSDAVTARGDVKATREKRPGNVSLALRARNVVVLVDPQRRTRTFAERCTRSPS
jgi:hypothetical protein